MKNIHILPTDKPSRLHLAYDKDFYLSVEPFIQLDTKNYKSFNIYITSDEEIKEGDYVYSTSQDYNIQKVSKGLVKAYQEVEHYKKIILTTDLDLIKDGVQGIDDEFLEWFVKNPSCENVELQKWAEDSKEFGTAYSIIFPKEEPKQETLEEAFEKWSSEQSGYNKLDVLRFGAKWQQEQIGKSEFLQRLRGTLSDAEARRLIFEQFKKKNKI
jgi:hypothetical protein